MYRFVVDGLKGPRQVADLRRAVEAIDGVERVEIDPETGQVAVDAPGVDEQDMKVLLNGAIRRAGFEVLHKPA